MRFLTAFLLIFGICGLAWGSDLSVESKAIRQGDIFSVQVDLQNAVGVGYLGFELTYPPGALQVLGFTPGTVAQTTDPQDPTHPALYATNPERFPERDMDRFRFAWSFAHGYTGGGELFTVQFRMNPVDMTQIPIQIVGVSALDAQEPYPLSTTQLQDGLIGVRLYGDVNGDGVVNEADAMQILQYLVGLQLLPQASLDVSDVSGQGGVSPLDAAFVLMRTVGLLSRFPVFDASQAAPVQVAGIHRTLQAGTMQIQDRLVTVPLHLENADGVLSGKIRVGYDPQVLRFSQAKSTGLTNGYTLLAHERGDEVAIGFAGDRPMAGTGELLTLEFTQTASAQGNTALQIREATFNEEILPMHQKIDLRFTPDVTSLLPNYPNPFNPETWIPYQLAEDAAVSVQIYDLQGRLVRTFDLGRQPKGYYTSHERAVHWDGRNLFGEHVASGVYVYRMRAGKALRLRKLVVLK